MNKIIVLFTVLVFLVGCGGSGSGDDSNSTSEDINTTEIEKALIEIEEKERVEAIAKAEKERVEAEAVAKAEEERVEAEAVAKAEEERAEAEAVAKAEEERAEAEAVAQEEKERLEAESYYYGKWIFAENGDELMIDTRTTLKYEAINENLLMITEEDGTQKSYLRASPSKVNLKGSIKFKDGTYNVALSKSPSRRKISSRIGSMNVILKNISDSNIQAIIPINEDGIFEDNSLPADEYIMTVEHVEESNIPNDKPIIKKIDTVIKLTEKTQNLGQFILLEENEHNFKAELLLTDSYIVADNLIHTATIRVHNISSQKAYGIWFDIKIKNEDNRTYFKSDINGNIVVNDINYSDNTMSDDTIGTIFPKFYKDITISFAFEPIYKNNKNIIVDLTINDADGNNWNENLKFVLYKGTFDINMDTSKANLKGYLRLPYNDEILAIDMEKGSITLPLLSEDKHYPLILANSGKLGGETKYSIGIESATLDFSNFKNTGAYENDDSESEATDIGLYQSVISYIHYGDLDYWKITTQENINKLYKEDNFVTTINVFANDIVISNAITIKDTAIEIVEVDNNATFILNGYETNLSQIAVNFGDKVAIKVVVPSDVEMILITLKMDNNSNRVWRIEIEKKISTLKNGLVAHYEFEGNADDSSGNRNHGTEYGGVSYVDGVIGKAGSFDGVDDWIKSSSSDFSNSTITTSVWVYKTEWTKGVVLAKIDKVGANGDNYGTSVSVSTGEIVVRTESSKNGDDFYARYEEQEINQWINIIQVLSNKEIMIYINGELVDKTSLASNFIPYTGNAPLQIGGSPLRTDGGTSYYKGLMDELRIYNRTLSESEIQELYNLGK